MVVDEIELFRCVVCGNYRLVGELMEITVRDFLFKKQICKSCFEKITVVQAFLFFLLRQIKQGMIFFFFLKILLYSLLISVQ